jgi:hypothetical protein
MTDPTTAAPLVAFIEPFLISINAVIAPLLVAWGISVVSRWTGQKMDQAAQDKLEAAATNEAGKIILAADRSIANAKLDERSAVVVASATKILNAPGLQAAINRLGITPGLVASLVAGALGQAQKSMVPEATIAGGFTLAPPVGSQTVVQGNQAVIHASPAAARAP